LRAIDRAAVQAIRPSHQLVRLSHQLAPAGLSTAPEVPRYDFRRRIVAGMTQGRRTTLLPITWRSASAKPPYNRVALDGLEPDMDDAGSIGRQLFVSFG
jgi:hypothetical protein